MAAPPILLREFHSATISDWIPPKLTTKYQQLELLAFGILSKDIKQWDVHFHLEDGLCEGKALPFLWDNGAYFDSECLVGGKLHLFAHFQKKEYGNQALATPATSMSFSRSIIERPAQHLNHHTPASTMSHMSTRERLVQQAGLRVSISRGEQRLDSHGSSDSDSDVSDETNFLLSRSDDGRQSGEEGKAHDVNHALRPEGAQLQLPVNATAAQHSNDFNSALLSNAPKGKYGHKDNWDNITMEDRSSIAHAKLIKGIYGMTAPAACDHCAEKGAACRVYHLELRASGATPGACGECRLRGTTCEMNGRLHHRSCKKKRTSDTALEAPPSKILRRETGGESATNLDYCPILSCPRRKDPFYNKANFLRHIRSAHPDYDASSIDCTNTNPDVRIARTATTPLTPARTFGAGTFVCPVVSCTSSALSRGDNFRRHVRQKHPESVYALILEAVVQGIMTTLPPPPSSDEFNADFEQATSTNAPPGAFGYRSPLHWTGTTPQVRTRLAHAKMIQGKYGVMAPESCRNCRKRKTTCMLYHPNLVNTSKAMGTYCGECRDRSVKCEMLPYPFAKILAPAVAIPDTQEKESVQASAEIATVKHEDDDQEDELLDSREHDHDNNSVIGDKYLEFSTYDDEHDPSNNHYETGLEEEVGDDGVPPETTFSYYSKYMDNGAEHVAK